MCVFPPSFDLSVSSKRTTFHSLNSNNNNKFTHVLIKYAFCMYAPLHMEYINILCVLYIFKHSRYIVVYFGLYKYQGVLHFFFTSTSNEQLSSFPC